MASSTEKETKGLVRLRINSECVMEFPMENSEGFLILLRIFVVLVHLPTPGIWNRLKRTADTGCAKSQTRKKMPLTNSLILLLRHVLHFVCFMKRVTRGNAEANIPANYPTAEKIMEELSKLAEDNGK